MLDPTSYYGGIVASDMKLSRREGKKAQERLEKSKAYSHGILVRTLYQPKIFTSEHERFLRRAAETMYAILEKVMREYECNDEYRRLFGFDKRLEELILRPKAYECPLPVARIDLFFDEDDYSFKFCEFNADGASAMNEDKELFAVISQTAAFKRFAERYEIKSAELFDSWAECFLDIYKTSENAKETPKETPNVAIVDFLHGEKHNNEFEAFKKAFEDAGCKCEICDITKLDYKNGALYSRSGMRIDAVYRRAVTCDIMENYGEVGAFLNAARENAVILIGDFRTQIIHNKILFKILHDDMTKRFLTTYENGFVEAHIPFTVSLTEENVDKYEVQKEIEIVCAPGLDGVEVTEESYVVIAGMGTMTILDILSSPQTSKIQHLILQSNRELETLRKEVTRLGFRIREEYALEEKGIFYVVILWERGSATYQEMEYRYGPYLLKHDLDYLKQMLRREKELFVRLPENHSKKRSEQKKTIAFLEKRIASFSK